MKKILSSSFLYLMFAIFFKINAQTCQNPYIACSSLNNNTLTQCGTSFSYPAITLNNPCVQGTVSTDFGCGIALGTPQNQSWFIITITNANGENLDFEFTNSNNQNINGVIWGPISSDLSRACYYLEGIPTSCDFDAGNPNLRIPVAYTGRTYIMMLNNHSGNATNVNISQPTGGGSVNFCRFIPDNNTCQKPTATILSNKTVLSGGQESRLEIAFTGTPPFYYTFGDGSYEYYSTSNYTYQTSYSSDSYELKLANVRNSCGYGTVLNDTYYLKVLEKDTVLRSCYPFNGNTLDGVSANHATINGAISTNGRNNAPNQAYLFDGIDDAINMNARDYPAEQYTLAAWVFVPTLPSNGAIQKIISIGADDFEQYIGIANNAQTGNQGAWIIGGKFYDGAAPSTSFPATANQWVHLCSVKTLDSLKLFINGNLVRRVYQGSFPEYSNNPRARIGGSINNREYFNGKIDEVKIFSGALKNNHVRDLFNSTDCSFKLCNDIPIATCSPSVYVASNDGINTSFQANITGEGFYLVSSTTEMPRKVNINNTDNVFYFGVQSDSSNISINKLTHLSGRCGTGTITNTAKVVIAPIIKSCLSFNGNTINYASTRDGYTSATYTNDRFGSPNKALNFNGYNSVNLGNANYFIQNVYTISAWINLSAFPQNTPLTIFAGGSNGIDHRLSIALQNTTNLITLRHQSSSNDENFIEVPINIKLNEWVHVAVSYKRGKVWLYLNGHLITTGYLFLDNGYFTESSVGAKTGGYAYGFTGKIDDVKVFQGTLSDAQILEVFNSIDCDYSTCDEKPTGQLTAISDATYDEYAMTKLDFGGPGPWIYKLDKGQTTSKFSTDLESSEFPYSPLNNATTILKLSSVQNACGNGVANGKIVINVLPKTQNCYLLNNNGNNSLGIYPATLHSTISSTDRFNSTNSAFELDGINAYIDVPINNLLIPEYSISLWVKPYNQTNSPKNIISLGTNNRNQKLAYLFDNSLNSWVWSFSSASYSSTSIIKSTNGISQNQWHHIVLTRSFQNQQLFIDGILVAKNILSDLGAIYDYGSCIFVGKGYELNDAFAGKIDELRFFKGSLNEGEVRKIFRSSSSSCAFTPCPSLKISEENITETKRIEAGKTISSNSQILSNTNVTFDSGGEINLNPGFKVANNSVFKAIIDGCGN